MCYQYFNTVATLFKLDVRVTEFIIEIFRAADSDEKLGLNVIAIPLY